MLRDDALVLDRHLPAGERNHARAQRHVTVVKRCAEQRLHARRMLMLRHRLGVADHKAVPASLVPPLPLGRSAARKRATDRATGGPGWPAGRAWTDVPRGPIP